MARCRTHATTSSAAACRSCLREFCADCLVYSFGPAKAPYCSRCALVAAEATIAVSASA